MIGTVDRRAVKVIDVYNGQFDENPYGLVSWWVNEDAAIDTLIDRVDAAYESGFRRFFINKPAGNVSSFDGISNASIWLTMEDWKREQLLDRFKTYWETYRKRDCTLGLITGFLIPDHYNPEIVGHGGGSHVLDMKLREDVEFNKANLQNWIKIGVREIVVENVNEKDIDSLKTFAASLWLSKIKVHGYALPLDSTDLLLQRAVNICPWATKWSLVRSDQKWNQQFASFDLEATECGAIIEADNRFGGEKILIPASRSDIEILHNRGFVLWSMGTDLYDANIIDVSTGGSGRPPEVDESYIYG